LPSLCYNPYPPSYYPSWNLALISQKLFYVNGQNATPDRSLHGSISTFLIRTTENGGKICKNNSGVEESI
jgi:hypothetical protein